MTRTGNTDYFSALPYFHFFFSAGKRRFSNTYGIVVQYASLTPGT